MTPVSEMPFGARCKSRKEKNKLASRACRLKKKAQHEANKLKCDGLLKEHRKCKLFSRSIFIVTLHFLADFQLTHLVIYLNNDLGDLANSLEHVKNILLMKMDPNTAQTQSELTAELDRTVKKSMGKH